MNKPKAQGTRWETELVQKAQAAGLLADRMPEGGMNDAGDVWIGDTPFPSGDDIAVVAWHRLIDTGNTRRAPDGVPSVVVMTLDDFLKIALEATQAGISFVAECKATERLNVTRELHDAKRKLARWKER